ncbi:hypothetical protein NMY22_g19141 [Coprinellus aureogranulatus]|nr:hypothetical protein NMY22_g19141 [Coprinellus aureogranulatus]
MPPALPKELIDLIIEHLAEAPPFEYPSALLSFSLASSSFLDQCQQLIFQAVRLRPIHRIGPDAQDTLTSESLKNNKRASLFIKAISRNPTLGQYVRRLDYQTTILPRNVDPDLEELICALELMPNIDDFAVGTPVSIWHSNSYGPAGFSTAETTAWPETSRWRGAMRDVMRRPRLRTLRLNNMTEVPLDHLSSGIRDLHLDKTRIAIPNPTIPPGDLSSLPIELKSFTTDSFSIEDDIDRYLQAVAGSHPTSVVLDLSRLRALKFEDPPSGRLLNQATCLETLEIYLRWSSDLPPKEFRQSFLRDLHPSSWNTLSHLKIRVATGYHNCEEPELELDPYAGVCGGSLRALVNIQHLQFDVGIIGRHYRFTPRFEEWRQLPDILSEPNSLPKLRRLAIEAHVRLIVPKRRADGWLHPALEDPTEQNIRRNVESAEAFCRALSQLVYIAQFRPAITFRPELDLLFVAEASII